MKVFSDTFTFPTELSVFLVENNMRHTLNMNDCVYSDSSTKLCIQIIMDLCIAKGLYLFI